MNIFPRRSTLSDPRTVEVIPSEDFTYVITRGQLDAFNAVHAELQRTDLSRKKLAKRMGMNEGQLSRLLAAPGNWGLGTFTKLFWAISGARVKFAVEYPLQKPPRNDTRPHWGDDTLGWKVSNTVPSKFISRLQLDGGFQS